MKDHDPVAKVPGEREARETLAAAIKNETYLDYATGEGPITISQLPRGLIVTPGFQEFLAEYGWPSQFEDGAIEPAHSFASNDEFLNALLGNQDPSLPDDKYLNNFRFWLQQPPTEKTFAELGPVKFHSTHPAIHRLYVAAPDLAGSVQQLYASLDAENIDWEDLRARFADEENDDLVTGARMLYSIIARLLKTTDKVKQMKTLFPDSARESAPIITSAKGELYT